MKKILFTLIGTLSLFIVQAQVYRNVSAGGDRNTIRAKRTDEGFEGSPYLFNDWQEAILKFGAGIEPSSSEIKYDLLADVLVLKGKDGEEYEFKDQPKEFLIIATNEVFKNGFTHVDKFTENTFYNVIYNGKTKFLKKTTKNVIESKGYNTATITKKITDDSYYYIVKDENRPVKIKYNEKSILSVLGKADVLLPYIKENKIDVKSTTNLIKLLTYYDTL